MNTTEIKQRIGQSIENLNIEELILVENLLKELNYYLKFNKSSAKAEESEIVLNNEDPLAELRNSNFIGCFESEADLSEKSEAIVKDILSQKYIN